MKKSRLGFTLIELLIVIVIIGILSVAFLPTVLSGPRKARDARRVSDVNAILQAVQSYDLENATALVAGTGNAIPTALDKYFPNNQAPQDPDPAKKTVYKFYVSKTGNANAGACYIVGATLEAGDNANSNETDITKIDCSKALAKPDPKDTTNYFYYQFIKQ